MRKSESILERVLFSCSKLVITGQPEIYERNGAEVTPSRFLRGSCFYIVFFPQTLKNGATHLENKQRIPTPGERE